jgi:hypothetical protein
MLWSDMPWSPSSRMLRQFAGLWIVFFAGLGAYQTCLREHTALGLALLGLAITVGPLGLLYPAAIRPIFVGWMVLAFPIGWVVSHVVLACLYFGLFTPVALYFRLIGRDVLCRGHRPGQASYWAARPAVTDMRSYFRQF